jgi:hypothetical protein
MFVAVFVAETVVCTFFGAGLIFGLCDRVEFVGVAEAYCL